MKKFITLFFAVCIVAACKKDPKQGPQTTTYVVTVLSDPNGTISPGTMSVKAGASATFSATPNPGYSVATVTDNGNPVSLNGSSYTVSDINANHQIKFTFSKLYTITVVAGPNGTASFATQQVVSGGSAIVSFTGITGFHVDSVWLDGTFLEAGEATYTFTSVTTNHTVKVTFTDALSQKDIDALWAIVMTGNGTWYLKGLETKLDPPVFSWQNLFQDCQKDDYLLFKSDHSYLYSINGTSCNSGRSADETGQSNLTANGKGLVFNHSGVKDTLIIEKLTIDSLVGTAPDPYQAHTHLRYRYASKK